MCITHKAYLSILVVTWIALPQPGKATLPGQAQPEQPPRSLSSLQMLENSPFSVQQKQLPLQVLAEVGPVTVTLEQARQLRDRGELKAAIAIYQTLLRQEPNNVQVQRELAVTYLLNGDYVQSAELLEILRANFPTDIELNVLLADAYSWLGKSDQALALYQSVLQMQPDNIKAQLGLARLFSWQGKRREAIARYETILQQNPDNLEAQLQRAQLLSWMGQLNRAVAAYNAILNQDPDNLAARLGKAQSLSWSGQFRSALALYESILAVDNKNLAARLGQAETLGLAGRHADALLLYESILKSNPEAIEAWQGRAQVVYFMGRTELAIDQYQQALTRFPQSESIRLGLARLLVKEQQIRQAITTLQPLLERQNWEAEELLQQIRAVEVTLGGLGEQFSNRSNWFIQQTTRFRVQDSNSIQFVRTGFGEFYQDSFSSLNNIPLQFGIETKVNQITLKAKAGVDFYNRLPATAVLGFEAGGRVLSKAILTGVVEYGAYKYSVESLENNIRAVRFGPNFAVEIDRNTSLFSSFRLGSYSDSNFENEFSIYLERRFSNFFLAANVYHLGYAISAPGDSLLNGYFAPASYWYYAGEFGWEGTILHPLKCRISVALGGQTPVGGSTFTNSYQTRCTARISPTVEASLGYRGGSLLNVGAGSNNSQSLFGQMRFQF